MRLKITYHTPNGIIESGYEEMTLNEGIEIIKKFKSIAKLDSGFNYLEYNSSLNKIPEKIMKQRIKEKFFQNFWVLPPEVAKKTIVEFNAEYTEEEKEQIEEGDFEV
jgi:hypothetical protein